MTFRRYWPWWVAFAWLIGYELYAIVSHTPTLSQMVWQAHAAWPPMMAIVLAVVFVLLAHFFIRRRRS